MSGTKQKSFIVILVVVVLIGVGLMGIGAAIELARRDSDVSSPPVPTSSSEAPSSSAPARREVSVTFADLPDTASLTASDDRSASLAVSGILYDDARVAFHLAPSMSGAGELVNDARTLAQELRAPVFVAAAPGGEAAASIGGTAAAPGGGTEAPSGEAAAPPDAKLIAELNRLGVRQVVSSYPDQLAGWDGEVIALDAATSASAIRARLTTLDAPDPVRLTVLTSLDVPAARAMLEGAGAHVLASGPDPRGDAHAIEALAAEPNTAVVGLFETDNPDFTWQVTTARTGEQLPGGGQLVFADKRYVALYGTPVSEAMGLLGEQGVDATVTRAQQVAAEYAPYSAETVVPSLEIIVTVAAGTAGPDGNYSNEWTPQTFIPLIEAARAAGQYVILDFQPGRSDFTSQIRQYEALLEYPNVGVALDPEWRLGPSEMPLTRVGHVEIAEVNEAINYVADVTRERDLPQKMVIMHQFQLQMLRDLDQVDQSRAEVSLLVQADGQGTQAAKAQTWQAIVGYVPAGIPLGWKNFIDEDVPMLSPQQTMQVEPRPWYVSYQ